MCSSGTSPTSCAEGPGLGRETTNNPPEWRARSLLQYHLAREERICDRGEAAAGADAGRARAELQREREPTEQKTRPTWPSRRGCASPLPVPMILSRSAVRARWDRPPASVGSHRKPPTAWPSPPVTPSACGCGSTLMGAGPWIKRRLPTCPDERRPYRVRKPRRSCTGGLTRRSARSYSPAGPRSSNGWRQVQKTGLEL